jgi:splicing factor 3B subunit 2
MALKRSKNQLRREKAKLKKVKGDRENSDINKLEEKGLETHQKEMPEQSTLEPISATTTVVSSGISPSKETIQELKMHNNSEESTETPPKEESVKEEYTQISTIDHTATLTKDQPNNNNNKSSSSNSEISAEITSDDPLFLQFSSIFTKFQGIDDAEEEEPEENQLDLKGDVYYSSDSDVSDSDSSKPLSSRQLRKSTKVPLALLKSATNNPQLVDWYDVDAKDPYLLVALKSQPNAVQVPEHWTAKREYLSQRKGLERPPFQLPKYIQDTGIQDMRGADDRNLRQQQRDKVQPKMGRLDIDYQRLHDAFFKHQSKPRLFGFGDLYFEGREGEDFKEEVLSLKPGVISSALRKALELPDNNRVPPPWISLMVKLGKSQSYKQLLIPGVDMEYDNKGYRDGSIHGQMMRGEHWGKLTEESDSEEEEEEEEEEEVLGELLAEDQEDEVPDDDEQPVKVAITEVGRNGRQVSTKSVPIESDEGPKSLYRVLEEKKMDAGDGILDSKVGYNLGNGNGNAAEELKEEKEHQQTSAKKFKF